MTNSPKVLFNLFKSILQPANNLFFQVKFNLILTFTNDVLTLQFYPDRALKSAQFISR